MSIIMLSICFPVEPYPKGDNKKKDGVILNKRQWGHKDT